MKTTKLLPNRFVGALLMVVLLYPVSAMTQDWVYTVVPGDNLWDFSEKHLDSVLRFDQLRKLNNIAHPRKMPPGSRIRVPLKWVRSNPVPAEIAAVQGSVRLFRAAGEVEAISGSGTLVRLGDRIKTGAESSVAIRFADDSILTLHADSLIRFDHLSAHGVTGMVDSRLHLLEGRMDTRVTKSVGPGSRFEIHTPSAISAVRGTEYRAAVEPATQSSNVEVLRGRVAVKGGSKRRLVKAGFGTRVEKGEAPIAPRKLLDAPVLNPIPERIRTLNWLLSWVPIDGAVRYRVEVADASQFDTLIWENITDYPKIGLPDLLDDQYHVRVRGIDELGLEGEQQVGRFVMDTRPQPPLQLKPAGDAVYRGETPQLQWTDSAEAAHYRLEIARDERFDQLLVQRDDVEGTHFDTAQLSRTGRYYWRLTSIAPDGELGPAGSVRYYEIKPVPAKITAKLDTADDGRLFASWMAGSPGQSYQVQIADDPEFETIELDTTLSEPQLGFDPVMGQVRYLRVRGIEPDGYQGPWGAVQRIDPPPDDSIWAVPALWLIGILLI